MIDSYDVILFDAVGTLIHPCPGVTDVYYRYAQQHGSRYSSSQIAERFRDAYHRIWSQRTTTDEQLEWLRWQQIVRQTIDDVRSPEILFEELWEHFADAGNWQLTPGTEPLLRELHRLPIRMGVASNFDGRLRGIWERLAAHLPPLELFISSELGFCKPDARFYREVEARLRDRSPPPTRILMVGDDWQRDVVGACAQGWDAIHVGSDSLATATQPIQTSLESNAGRVVGVIPHWGHERFRSEQSANNLGLLGIHRS